MNFNFFFLMQLLRPIYKQIAENQNAEIFSANTLLVILGTSLLTARVGVLMLFLVNSLLFIIIVAVFMCCSNDVKILNSLSKNRLAFPWL